jgi:hypothetical protein
MSMLLILVAVGIGSVLLVDALFGGMGMHHR